MAREAVTVMNGSRCSTGIVSSAGYPYHYWDFRSGRPFWRPDVQIQTVFLGRLCDIGQKLRSLYTSRSERCRRPHPRPRFRREWFAPPQRTHRWLCERHTFENRSASVQDRTLDSATGDGNNWTRIGHRRLRTTEEHVTGYQQNRKRGQKKPFMSHGDSFMFRHIRRRNFRRADKRSAVNASLRSSPGGRVVSWCHIGRPARSIFSRSAPVRVASSVLLNSALISPALESNCSTRSLML